MHYNSYVDLSPLLQWTASEQWWLSEGQEGSLSELLRAVVYDSCTQWYTHTHTHTHVRAVLKCWFRFSCHRMVLLLLLLSAFINRTFAGATNALKAALTRLLFVFVSVLSCLLPSVLWHCWLGGRKGIRPVENRGWWRWALVCPDGVAPS